MSSGTIFGGVGGVASLCFGSVSRTVVSGVRKRRSVVGSGLLKKLNFLFA